MLQWIQLIEVIAPPILMVIPGIPPTLIPVIVLAIQRCEQLPWLQGAEKKELVLKAVQAHVASTLPPNTLSPEGAATVSRAIDATIIAANEATRLSTPVLAPTPIVPLTPAP